MAAAYATDLDKTSTRGRCPEPYDDEPSMSAETADRRDDRIRRYLIASGFIIRFEDKQNWQAIPPSQQEWSF